MNILFVADDIQFSSGGIERVTDIQVRLLSQHGHSCYVIYRTGICHTPFKDLFQIRYTPDQRYHFPEEFARSLFEEVKDFVVRNRIDMVVNTRDWPLLSVLSRKIADLLHIKHVNYIHHQIYDRQAVRRDILNAPPSWKRSLKKTFFPLYWLCFRRKISRNYRLLYRQCDAMVILSESFRRAAVSELASYDNGEKLFVIPNPTAFERAVSEEVVDEKEKTVLIVARMEERSKNIYGALRIWADIERSGAGEWNLEIVGDGPDLPDYKQWVEKEALRRVKFVGHVNDIQVLSDHYKRAAIFMMTSYFEGFGMTLIEAQACGCVPLAFDNFSALHDIISDRSNGLIIPTGDYRAYTQELKLLMREDGLRRQMALCALESCKKFNRECHYRNWEKLFEKLS